jgi:hypothetical protein
MSSIGIVTRLDDWLNPIVVRELRQAVKSRIVLAVLALFLLLQLSIIGIFLVASEIGKGNTGDLYAGRAIFQVLQGILLGTCMVLIPAYAGVRLAAERSDTNVDLLFISTLRPRSIIAGKFLAAVVLILLVFSACAPFMTFTYLLRGIDISSIFIVLAVDFLAVLLGAQLALFLGSIPTTWGVKVFLGLFGLNCLGWLFGGAMGGSVALLELGIRPDSPEFWMTAAGLVTAVAAVAGLLLTWSVVIVSPPSFNRALPVRLYLLAAWLVTAGMAALLARYFHTPMFLEIWMVPAALLFSGQLLASINEREHWGMRVAQTIPRRSWLRLPAFLLYSGSAGGLLFAVILLALTISLPSLVVWRWSYFSPVAARYEVDITHRNAVVMALIALYTYDYALTSVVLRNVVFAGLVKPLYTWLLTLGLAALGTMLPYVFLFLFAGDEIRTGNIEPWWLITNPFASIIQVYLDWTLKRGGGFLTDCLVFVIGWAVLVTLLCLPWMVRQMARFHPPQK